jgi:hypothetical protein
MEIDSIWDELKNDLYLAALEMNRKQLDKELERVFSEYPVELLADNLILPLINQLRTDQFPQASVEMFFMSVLEEQLCRMQYRQRQTAKGKKTPGNDGIASGRKNYRLVIKLWIVN